MCGIAIVNSVLQAERIKHRGLFSNSIELRNKIGVHFCLPIQTNIKSMKQPIELLGHGRYLFYNGEIFNYPFSKFESDTEYIANFFNGFPTIGEIQREISKWEGFWAIVIIDKLKNEVLCFTDPLGKKQLYYNDAGEIASEIRPLIDYNNIRFDRTYFSQVSKWGYNINCRTPYEGIYRLQPNFIFKFSLLSPKKKEIYGPYFDFNINLGALQNKNLEQLIRRSTKFRLISRNYPISCLISGGIDSSIIAKSLVDLGAKVSFFTIENEESEYVDLLADHLGIQVKYLDYKMSSDLSEVYWANETPVDLGSVVPQFELFKAIKKEEFRITLSGDGADELFGGYRRISEYDSQKSDIFDELTYYHLPRLDHLSMYHTIELRSPFLSLILVKFALSLKYAERMHKNCLKSAYHDKLPLKIIDRPKIPLKNPEIKLNKFQYIRKICNNFPDIIRKFLN